MKKPSSKIATLAEMLCNPTVLKAARELDKVREKALFLGGLDRFDFLLDYEVARAKEMPLRPLEPERIFQPMVKVI